MLCSVEGSISAQSVAVSPTSLSFGNQVLGTTSSAQKVAVSVGAFLKSYFEKLGERGATVTIQILESGSIGRLAPSRITALTYRVSVINNSTEATEEEIKKVTAALQDQVHNDLAPIWGVDAQLRGCAEGQATRS